MYFNFMCFNNTKLKIKKKWSELNKIQVQELENSRPVIYKNVAMAIIRNIYN